MIRVQTEDFDMGLEYARLCEGRMDIGGACLFVGRVRDMATEGNTISAMTLEHYPAMVEKQLNAIEAEAHTRWELFETLIIHRHGRLEAGEQIVMVAATAAHRDAAFEACRFLMDWLKTQAPFWKKEATKDSEDWVASRESDERAAAKWNK